MTSQTETAPTLRGKLQEKIAEWRKRAVDSIEEAGRIRRTVKEPTEAEDRCLVRSQCSDAHADELESLLSAPADKPAVAPSGDRPQWSVLSVPMAHHIEASSITFTAGSTDVALAQLTKAVNKFIEEHYVPRQHADQPSPSVSPAAPAAQGGQFCSKCGSGPLIFSCREVGDGLCHPCGHKLAAKLREQLAAADQQHSESLTKQRRSLCADHDETLAELSRVREVARVEIESLQAELAALKAAKGEQA